MHHSGSIGGVSRSALAALGVPMDLAGTSATPPQDWQDNWQVALWEPQASLFRHGAGVTATLDNTPAEIFDLFSTARSAPANTYHVSPNGSDAGAGTEAAPFRSIWKAVSSANASGLPAKVVIKAGEYGKPHNPSQFLNLRPTVDIAFVATGGRVIVGTWDDFGSPAKDATYANCHSYALGNVDRVIDRARLDADGFHPDLLRVSDAATCNRIADSWTLEAGRIYINRADGKAVTDANTRVLRAAGGTWRFDTPVSVYVGGEDSISGFDTQGGSGGAGFHYQPDTKPAAMKAVVVERSTFGYCGGSTYEANGALISNLHGLALFADCDASNNVKDGFSVGHNGNFGARGHMITANCRAILCGRGSAQSCNSLTAHDDTILADFAGEFGRSNGGSVRTIGTSRCWLAGTAIADDRGDRASGGTTPPAAIMAGDSAQIWADRAVISMPPATAPVFADTQAAVRLRAMPPMRSNPQGTGTVEPW
ncbi:hypothetical protein [Croceicoccus sediminis]|uniref:hypothetical protein n=1 Tax=Croceicoccus sediminis TaxID=2571150 RepID=UPI00118444DC|nr:hypothetical protein [Croceicoccus sediminis]